MNMFATAALVALVLELVCLAAFARTRRPIWGAGVYFFWVLTLWNVLGYFAMGVYA